MNIFVRLPLIVKLYQKLDLRIMLREFLHICVLRLGTVYIALSGAVGVYLYHRSATGNSFTGSYYAISSPIPFINLLVIIGLAIIVAVFWLQALQKFTLRSSETLLKRFLALAYLTLMPLIVANTTSYLLGILL